MRPSATLAGVRIRSFRVVLCAALALPAASAGAADQAVTINPGSNLFVPADVTVQKGDTVTWTNNSGGFHNVRFVDGSFEMPAIQDSSPWSVSRSFATVGVFTYYCEEHGFPNGVDMAGTVNVKAAGTLPPPDGVPVSADTVAPTLKLSGSRRQRVLRQRAVFVRAVVSEAASVVVRARVYVPRAGAPLRTQGPARQLVARRVTNFKLRLSNRTLRAARRGLRKHSRLTARIAVTADDSAGNRAVAKRTVKLKR
jgi:plastocyanin